MDKYERAACIKDHVWALTYERVFAASITETVDGGQFAGAPSPGALSVARDRARTAANFAADCLTIHQIEHLRHTGERAPLR